MRHATAAIVAAALAASTTGLNATERSIRVGAFTSQPIGHFEFCRKHPSECGAVADRGPETLGKSAWSLVRMVNRKVNAAITARSDQEIHGRKEVWSLPVQDMGDCEDYALLKRRILIEDYGFSPSNLLMTVVKKRDNSRHPRPEDHRRGFHAGQSGRQGPPVDRRQRLPFS